MNFDNCDGERKSKQRRRGTCVDKWALRAFHWVESESEMLTAPSRCVCDTRRTEVGFTKPSIMRVAYPSQTQRMTRLKKLNADKACNDMMVVSAQSAPILSDWIVDLA